MRGGHPINGYEKLLAQSILGWSVTSGQWSRRTAIIIRGVIAGENSVVAAASVRLEAPPQVRLLGKDRKGRFCPLWPVTARLLRDLMCGRRDGRGEPHALLAFTNALDGEIRGHTLWRIG